jgi:hypothetical protein
MQDLHQMTEGDVNSVVSNLSRILKLSEDMAKDGSARAFEIYKLSRDTMEILAFDRISRDTLAKLTTGAGTFNGFVISEAVDRFIRNGQLINAIKEFRGESGLGLKEAKDWCEAYRDSIKPF